MTSAADGTLHTVDGRAVRFDRQLTHPCPAALAAWHTHLERLVGH